jgi:Flp pilus assembly protein TadG
VSKWKRRCRGAISIFLIIAFIANFALIGVLVDAGRYRMAKASAEMALDSATGSVLSYYNQMVYDLYGLFATDSLSNDAIAQLMTDYTEKTCYEHGVIHVFCF